MEDQVKRILLAEDDPLHARLIKSTLRNSYELILIDYALTGEQCLHYLKESTSYDLIILNNNLPEKNGIKILNILKKDFNYNGPVIILLRKRDEDLTKEALQSGATDCIIKTEDYLDRLLIAVKGSFKKYKPEDQQKRVIIEYVQSEELIPFLINGKNVIGRQGETILEVANRYGIEIPSLCYHPSVNTAGVCRICIVEVTHGKRKRLVPSCVYPVQKEISVETSTEKILKYRKMILELLLARCPDSEIIKSMAQKMGVIKTRFSLRHDPDSCILCGLCIRVCEEVIGANAISFSERGIHRKISTPFLELSETCTGCGECAKICPTGALTLKYIDQFIMKREKRARIAIKCDGCAGYKNRACVNNCPTGALEAMSISEFLIKNKGSINVELRELLKFSIGEGEKEDKNAGE